MNDQWCILTMDPAIWSEMKWITNINENAKFSYLVLLLSFENIDNIRVGMIRIVSVDIDWSITEKYNWCLKLELIKPD